MENLFKNQPKDKLMLQLLVLSMKDMLVINFTLLLMPELPKLLLYIITIFVMNMILIELMTRLEFQGCFMVDIKMITMEVVIHGF